MFFKVKSVFFKQTLKLKLYRINVFRNFILSDKICYLNIDIFRMREDCTIRIGVRIQESFTLLSHKVSKGKSILN